MALKVGDQVYAARDANSLLYDRATVVDVKQVRNETRVQVRFASGSTFPLVEGSPALRPGADCVRLAADELMSAKDTKLPPEVVALLDQALKELRSAERAFGGGDFDAAEAAVDRAASLLHDLDTLGGVPVGVKSQRAHAFRHLLPIRGLR